MWGWRTFNVRIYGNVNYLIHHYAWGTYPNSFRSYIVFLFSNSGRNAILVSLPNDRSWKTTTSLSFVSMTSNYAKSEVINPSRIDSIVFYG